MGLLRRKKQNQSVPASRLPGPHAVTNDEPVAPVHDPTSPLSDFGPGSMNRPMSSDISIIDEMRRAVSAASEAADRAAETAENAQRQALLATETARAATERPTNAVTTEQLTALTAEVEKLASLVRTSITESREARELVASLDTRITQLGVELANQIDELSGEVDGIASREPGDGAASAEVVADLKSGQVRLAQEQARYQIAFRDDLAALADEVRKRPSR